MAQQIIDDDDDENVQQMAQLSLDAQQQAPNDDDIPDLDDIPDMEDDEIVEDDDPAVAAPSTMVESADK